MPTYRCLAALVRLTPAESRLTRFHDRDTVTVVDSRGIGSLGREFFAAWTDRPGGECSAYRISRRQYRRLCRS